MALQDEIHQRLGRAVARTPWLLEFTTREGPLDTDKISTDELVHGLQGLVIELMRVTERLAGEIDTLRGG